MAWRLILFTLPVTNVGATQAQVPEDSVRSGKIAYRAFECAQLAGSQSDQAQKKRLIELGLSEARKMGQAYIDGSVSLDALARGEVMVTFYLDGPTPDFIAGQIYEGAGERVWARIKEDAGSDAPLEKIRQSASRLYEEKNCDLIGAKE